MPFHDDIGTPVILEDVTIYVAIELSGKSWVVDVKPPGSGKAGLHNLKTSDTRGLIALIERHREGALKKTGSTVRVLCCYEAGFEGFWLARCLETKGYETIVLDPSSLPANRKARQRKTGRIDAKKMIRALLAHDRGDSQVLSRVRVPSVAEEDRKRLLRLPSARSARLTSRFRPALAGRGVLDGGDRRLPRAPKSGLDRDVRQSGPHRFAPSGPLRSGGVV